LASVFTKSSLDTNTPESDSPSTILAKEFAHLSLDDAVPRGSQFVTPMRHGDVMSQAPVSPSCFSPNLPTTDLLVSDGIKRNSATRSPIPATKKNMDETESVVVEYVSKEELNRFGYKRLSKHRKS
jgi:hypothetical protein